MTIENVYDLPEWEQPRDYFGFSPIGDYVICGRSRDSDALEESNYRTIFKYLSSIDAPEPENDGEHDQGGEWVYDYRASHWAVGWVETLLIRRDAPDAVLMSARSVLDALEDYPVFDEMDLSELEMEQADELWRISSTSDRVHYIKKCGSDPKVSIFAARHDELPYGLYLSEMLY